MSKHPLDIIDPLAFAVKGRVVDGSLPLAAFSRLRDQLLVTSGDAHFHLRFVKEGTVHGVRGRVETEISLQCQACLGALRYGVEADLAIGFVTSIDEANLLPEPFEPVVLDDPHVLRVADLIEDEILLSVPQVPRHAVCPVADADRSVQESSEAAGRRPFAALGALVSANTKQNSD